jgi:hypothetical protein
MRISSLLFRGTTSQSQPIGNQRYTRLGNLRYDAVTLAQWCSFNTHR